MPKARRTKDENRDSRTTMRMHNASSRMQVVNRNIGYAAQEWVLRWCDAASLIAFMLMEY